MGAVHIHVYLSNFFNIVDINVSRYMIDISFFFEKKNTRNFLAFAGLCLFTSPLDMHSETLNGNHAKWLTISRTSGVRVLPERRNNGPLLCVFLCVGTSKTEKQKNVSVFCFWGDKNLLRTHLNTCVFFHIGTLNKENVLFLRFDQEFGSFPKLGTTPVILQKRRHRECLSPKKRTTLVNFGEWIHYNWRWW